MTTIRERFDTLAAKRTGIFGESFVTATPSISDVFSRRRAAGQLAFIPFVTAGDPDLDVTGRLVAALDEAGADLIEIGFPYSDPIADGPVIQASYTRALGKHVRLSQIFSAAAEWSAKISAPLVAMVSYALIFRTGNAEFLDRAAKSGFRGLIVPDLPGDEADEFAVLVRERGLDLIQLVAPTTPEERMTRILKNGSGFVYCIAVAGTTGVREAVATSLQEMLSELRQRTNLPLSVGFGLSRPEQVRELHGRADGAIVGSALVRHLDGIDGTPESVERAVAAVRAAAVDLAETAHEKR